MAVETSDAVASHPSYRHVSTELLEERAATVVRYEHVKTGAEVLSVSCEDTNKVFGVSFRTPPEDSTGVAHIMEHSVLCGE